MSSRRAIAGGLRTVRKQLQKAYDRKVAGGARRWTKRLEGVWCRTTSEKVSSSENGMTGRLRWTMTESPAEFFRFGKVADKTVAFPEAAIVFWWRFRTPRGKSAALPW